METHLATEEASICICGEVKLTLEAGAKIKALSGPQALLVVGKQVLRRPRDPATAEALNPSTQVGPSTGITAKIHAKKKQREQVQDRSLFIST